MYIVKSSVKKLAGLKGKRVSDDYYAYLSDRIRQIVESHCHVLGSRGTLRGKEFRAWDNMLK